MSEQPIVPVVHRLRRAQGQLAGVLRMIEECRPVEDVLGQLKAVSRALDRAGFALVANEVCRCAADGPIADEDLDRLEKFFLSVC